ncbi:MAG: putative rane protein [Thermoleophilia bacterium]|nr:putative rane protein [Thermoleophilia bacterium]
MSRTLRSYLLLPRPKDVIKGWLLPLSFAVGTLSVGRPEPASLLRAAIAWGILELLIYQARYQWNDIRGFEADQAHPDADERGRLPGPIERGPSRKRASWAVVGIRLALAAAIAVAAPALDLIWIVFALVVGVFGVAIVYEVARSNATGHGQPGVTGWITSLWLVAGGGYAIRGMAGMALAVDLGGRPGLALAATTAFWAFGVAFVTARWALESLAFAEVTDGQLRWRLERARAREHTTSLRRWLPSRVPDGAADGRPESWRPLAGATTLRAPWNLALLVSAASAAAAGALLQGASVWTGAVSVAGAVGAVLVARTAHARPALLLGWAAVLALVAWTAGIADPGLVPLPWLLVVGGHAFFAGQSLRTVGSPVRAALDRRRPSPRRAVVSRRPA